MKIKLIDPNEVFAAVGFLEEVLFGGAEGFDGYAVGCFADAGHGSCVAMK